MIPNFQKYLATGVALSMAFGAVDSDAQTAKKPVFRDAATSATLEAKLKKARENDPMAALAPAIVDGAPKGTPVTDLVKQSEVLSFNHLATLVPKGAVIHIPHNLQSRVGFEKGAKLVTWDKFFAANRGWISTKEVTFEQASGEQPFDEETRASMERSTRLTIATFKKGPISVLPPKVAAVTDSETQISE